MNRSLRKSEKPYKAQANLDALFGEETSSSEITNLKVDQIALPEKQPRRYFDPEKLLQLSESLRAHGILENLLVR